VAPGEIEVPRGGAGEIEVPRGGAGEIEVPRRWRGGRDRDAAALGRGGGAEPAGLRPPVSGPDGPQAAGEPAAT